MHTINQTARSKCRPTPPLSCGKQFASVALAVQILAAHACHVENTNKTSCLTLESFSFNSMPNWWQLHFSSYNTPYENLKMRQLHLFCLLQHMVGLPEDCGQETLHHFMTKNHLLPGKQMISHTHTVPNILQHSQSVHADRLGPGAEEESINRRQRLEAFVATKSVGNETLHCRLELNYHEFNIQQQQRVLKSSNKGFTRDIRKLNAGDQENSVQL